MHWYLRPSLPSHYDWWVKIAGFGVEEGRTVRYGEVIEFLQFVRWQEWCLCLIIYVFKFMRLHVH
jgi:hypothetical protein